MLGIQYDLVVGKMLNSLIECTLFMALLMHLYFWCQFLTRQIKDFITNTKNPALHAKTIRLDNVTKNYKLICE